MARLLCWGNYTFFLQECGLQESSTRLLKKLRIFSTGFLRPKKVDKFINTLNANFHTSPSSHLLKLHRVTITISVFQ